MVRVIRLGWVTMTTRSVEFGEVRDLLPTKIQTLGIL